MARLSARVLAVGEQKSGGTSRVKRSTVETPVRRSSRIKKAADSQDEVPLLQNTIHTSSEQSSAEQNIIMRKREERLTKSHLVNSSDITTKNESVGLVFAQGKGIFSLLLTIVVVSLLVLKTKITAHRGTLLMLLGTSLLCGFLYFFISGTDSCSEERQLLQMRLQKIEMEKRLMEKKFKLMEAKLRELGKSVTEMLDQELTMEEDEKNVNLEFEDCVWSRERSHNLDWKET
ncbi:uncharacterized protein O3C94_014704 [Discoglossus pictus]